LTISANYPLVQDSHWYHGAPRTVELLHRCTRPDHCHLSRWHGYHFIRYKNTWLGEGKCRHCHGRDAKVCQQARHHPGPFRHWSKLHRPSRLYQRSPPLSEAQTSARARKYAQLCSFSAHEQRIHGRYTLLSLSRLVLVLPILLFSWASVAQPRRRSKAGTWSGCPSPHSPRGTHWPAWRHGRTRRACDCLSQCMHTKLQWFGNVDEYAGGRWRLEG